MVHADMQQKTSSAQTEVTVKLIRPIVSNHLPGTNGDSNYKPNANGSSNPISIAKPDVSTGKNLPKTNEQNHLIDSILGGVLVGSVICFFAFRNKKERKVNE